MPEDYYPAPVSFAARLRRILTRRPSLRLLRTSIPPSPKEVEVFETLMRHLRLSSGVYKTTFPRRFEELDRFVSAALLKRFPREMPLAVHDWAASDCLTSSEWAATLFEAWPNATLAASDLTLFLIEIGFPDGSALIMEPDGAALQYVSGSFVANLNDGEAKPGMLRRLRHSKIQSRLAEVRTKLAIPKPWLASGEDSLNVPPYVLRKLPLVHPQAEAFRVSDRRFSILRHSAFEGLGQPVDVIRSMNIYNPGYFPPDRLMEGAETVWRSLHPGGWWIVGRTWREKPPASNVSILEKDEKGFHLVSRFGDGSEIESLVLAREMSPAP